MVIEGKVATSVRLHCPGRDDGCTGYIQNDLLIYLLEDESIYFWGECSECGQRGNLTLPLRELILQCPAEHTIQ